MVAILNGEERLQRKENTRQVVGEKKLTGVNTDRGIYTTNIMRRRNRPAKKQSEKRGLEYTGWTKWYANEPLRKDIREEEKYLDEVLNMERDKE